MSINETYTLQPKIIAANVKGLTYVPALAFRQLDFITIGQ
jgi:hypothetical protein